MCDLWGFSLQWEFKTQEMKLLINPHAPKIKKKKKCIVWIVKHLLIPRMNFIVFTGRKMPCVQSSLCVCRRKCVCSIQSSRGFIWNRSKTKSDEIRWWNICSCCHFLTSVNLCPLNGRNTHSQSQAAEKQRPTLLFCHSVLHQKGAWDIFAPTYYYIDWGGRCPNDKDQHICWSILFVWLIVRNSTIPLNTTSNT